MISIEDYLEELLGKTLYKEEQKELINMINLRDSRNKLQKKLCTLNGYLLDNYNMILISKKIKKQGKLVTIWVLGNIG